MSTDPTLEAARELYKKRVPLTLDYAFSLVDIAAEQEGRDYVYDRYEECRDGSCKNWLQDRSGKRTGDCLIGRVFEFFVDYNDEDFLVGQSTPAVQTNYYLGTVFDRDAIVFLDEVQMLQDQGVPWGEAIDHAKVQFIDKLEDKE